jgi:hypothetical protein
LSEIAAIRSIACSPLFGDDEVIDAEVARNRPFARKNVVFDAGQADGIQPMTPQPENELRRTQEFAPIMGTARQPAENIFGADDRQRKGACAAIDRRANEGTAGSDESADGGEKSCGIGDMLDHLERQHRVESGAAFRQRFGGSGAVVDRQPARFGMAAGGGDRRRAGIDAGHSETEARHRLCYESAATADIDQIEALERTQGSGIAAEMPAQLGTDEGEADGIEAVQRAETARGIPPVFGCAGKATDLFGIDRDARHTHSLTLHP